MIACKFANLVSMHVLRDATSQRPTSDAKKLQAGTISYDSRDSSFISHMI